MFETWKDLKDEELQDAHHKKMVTERRKLVEEEKKKEAKTKEAGKLYKKWYESVSLAVNHSLNT